MALHVGLMQNHLGTGPNLVTRVVERRTMSYDRFVELMAMESEMSAEGIRAVITLIRRQLLWALSSGERVVTPLGTFAAHAKGTTVEGGDTPTVRAEGVSVRYRADQEFVSDLRHAIELVNVGEVDRSAPVISCVADFETDGCLETIGAGTNGQDFRKSLGR